MDNLSKITDGSKAAASPDKAATEIDRLVMVVDDHDDTRALLKYVIELRGWRVVEAVDGEEAVLLAERVRPDLILMDTNLPRVDGLTATRRIRKLTTLHNVPIIFLSGHAQPEYRAVALATGGNEYFVKPINLSDLETAVEKQLQKANPEARGVD
jgi:CheY-like chemotaxis protein